MPTEISVRLTLTSLDGDPHDVTRRLGIEPDHTWLLHDLIDERATMRFKHNGWAVESRETSSIDLDAHVRSVLAQVQSAWKTLVEVGQRWDIEVSCMIMVRGDTVPSMNFDAELVRQIAQLGATIDIDLYCLGTKEA